MKKKLGQKNNRGSGKTSRRKRTQLTPKSKQTEERVHDRVAAVLTDAKKLQTNVGELHLKARELHQSVRDVHKASQGVDLLHSPASDRVDLVTEEKQPGGVAPFPIVGVGASAGGYEAFSNLVRHLPKDLGMAIVLVQHLDPHHKSKLTELLSQSAKLPVIETRNGMEVKKDHIYVIPENTTMTISEGRLSLSPREERNAPPMPIDLFFRSLAYHQQNLGIAIVLSGTGTDGTLGLIAIKGEGGVTFVQDEASAKYFGMPGSAIASGSVDFILDPAAMAKELVRIAAHPYVKREDKPKHRTLSESGEAENLIRESASELNTIFRLLKQRERVDFSLYKQSTLRRRIIRRMMLHKLDTVSSYIKLLQKDPAEAHSLFNDLLINVTNFFRDSKTFKMLQKRVFSRIVKAHAADSPLRFWTCGCATGEEAYSLAMSLLEFFDRTGAHHPAQIFATDISEGSVEKARAGIYPPNILQDVSQERIRRFFTKTSGGNYQVNKSIRDMCIFARQNVLTDPPFSNLDLITCRNVLIYFGPVLQRKIIPLFHYALRNTGFLLLGNSETIGSATQHFTLIDKKHKIYTKKPGTRTPGLEVVHRARALELQYPHLMAEKGVERETPINLQEEVDKVLLRDFSPAAVVINLDFEVMHFRGRTGDYLEHAPGTATLNLLKMARDSLVLPLRFLLNKAVKQDSTVTETGIELKNNGRTRRIDIEVRPFKLGTTTERFLIVVFGESKSHSLEFSRHKTKGNNKRHSDEEARLQNELQSTKESLRSIIEEQEATNEELKSANEEIQSSNEELQSTNEELETAKEELQSTNEELTTLNEELQNRNNELSEVNSDLFNLLASVSIPILMVGTDLTIRRFTPMAERIFNIIPSDVGRKLSDVNCVIVMSDLERITTTVIEDLVTVEREVQDREGRSWMLRIRPYRSRDNKIEGAVLLLLDIDELRRALEITLGLVKQPLIMLSPEMKVRSANDSFFATFGLTAKEVDGQSLFQLGNGQFDIPNLRLLLEDILPSNKRVTDYELEANFSKAGPRKLKLNATRFFEEGRGIQIILLAIEDVTSK